MAVKLREKKLKTGRTSLYLDIYQNGKRKYEFLKLYLGNDKKKNRETMQLAEAIRSKRELEIYNRKYDFDRKDEDLLFSDYVQTFADDKTRSGSKNYNSLLVHLRSYDKHDIAFDDLTANWIEGFKKFLLKKVKQNTARTYFLMFRSILNKAANRGIIKGNPLYKHQIKNVEKDPARINYLTDADVNKLWKTDCERTEVRRAFLFSVYTGLRLSDVIGLQWSDIQHISGNGEDYYQVELQQSKTKEYVHIPLSKTAEPLLDVTHKINNHVFQISESTVGYWLEKWAEKAKIKKHVHFHMARHTFATRLLRRGVDIYTVKDLMGHDSVSSTEKYLHVVNSDKKNAIDKL